MIKNYFKLPPKLLKTALKQHGWTQEDFADILGVSTSLINRVVNSKQKISYELLYYLCIALQLDKEKFTQEIFKYNLELEKQHENGRLSRSR